MSFTYISLYQRLQCSPSLHPPFLSFSSYSGCCWIGLNAGGGGWEIRVKGNLLRSLRPNGRVNSSPQTTSTPIIRLQQGCNHTIRIPAQDPDQDVVRCRWATSTGNECAGVCRALPGAIIDEVSVSTRVDRP